MPVKTERKTLVERLGRKKVRGLKYLLIAVPFLLYVFAMNYVPFQMQPCDFRIWNGDYINGNTTMILFLICILLAAAFTVGGIIITVKKRSAES